MRNIFRKTSEKERNQENSRLEDDKTTFKERYLGFKEGLVDKKEGLVDKKEGDLNCEEAIMKDKERFGRVRNSLMKYLRAEYGNDVADRALRRISKRRTEGYFKNTR